MSEEYCGHTNRETWTLALWINNEQSVYHNWIERAREAEGLFDLAESLREAIEEDADARFTNGPYQDLLTYAVSRIDWRQIAQGLLDDISEGVEV